MEEDQVSPPTESPTANSKNTMYLVAGVGLIILLAAIVLLKSQKNTSPTAVSSEIVTTNTDLPPEEGVPLTSTPTNNAVTNLIVTEGDIKVFNVESGGFYFKPAEIKVKVGDTVRIIVTNTQGTHDLVLDEFNVKTKLLTPGQTDQVEFIADRAGTFEYYCSVTNHRQQGMVGKLIVE